MADEKKFIARLQILGGPEAERTVQQTTQTVEASTQKMQSSFDRLGSRAEGIEGGFKKLNRGVNDAAGAIQILGGVIPGLDGAFSVLTRNIGNASDVFGTLSNILLRNPLGVAAVAISAAAAAFLYFARSSDDASKSLGTTSTVAGAAAINFGKLIDPLKTVAGLLDDVARKQIDALGGSKSVVGTVLEQKRAELVAARAALDAARAPLAPDARGREADDRPSQVQAAEQIARQQARALATQTATRETARLTPEIAKLSAEIQKLETQEQRLREIQDRNVGADQFTRAGVDDIVKGIKAEEEAARAKAAAAALASSAAQAQAIDSLTSKYAPLLQKENELAKARALNADLLAAGAIGTERYEQILNGIAEAEFALTESGQRRAELEAAALKIRAETVTAEERYAAAIRDTDEALKANLITTEQANRSRDLEAKKLAKSSDELADEAKSSKEFVKSLGLSFSSAFENAVVGGGKARDVLRGLGQDLLRISIRKSLTEPMLEFLGTLTGGSKGGASGGGILGALGSLGGILGGLFSGGSAGGSPAGDGGGILGGGGGGIFSGITSFLGSLFANGAAFDRGNVTPFARGGIVDRPTVFPMARGAGLMGEAGPEAVMPLTRGRDGRLGVAANGNAAGNVTSITIDARGSHHGMLQMIRQTVMHELAPIIAEGAVRRVEGRAGQGGNFSKAVGRRAR